MAIRFLSNVNILGGLQIGSVPTTNTSLSAMIYEGGTVKQRTLGTMALELTSNYYNKSDSDARFINVSRIGVANGITPLGADGKVPVAYLPSYISEVQEYANLAAFPNPGNTGVIYVALDTNFTYRWSGSTYVQLTGTGVQSVNGATGIVNLTTNNIPEGTNLYYTDTRVRNAISGVAPISFNPATGAISHNIIYSGAPGQDYNLVTIDFYGHISSAQHISYLTEEFDTLTSVTGRGAQSTNNFGVTKTTGATAINATSADSGSAIGATGRPASLYAENNLGTGRIDMIANTSNVQVQFRNQPAQLVLTNTTGLGVIQGATEVNRFVGNGQVTGADATANNHFVTRQQITNNSLANAVLNQNTAAQVANYWINGTGRAAKIGIGAVPENDMALEVRGYMTTSQGASMLANRTVMSWTTGGGYISGQTWVSGNWQEADLILDCINLQVRGNVIAEGEGVFQGGGFDSLRELKKNVRPWQRDAIKLIEKTPIYSFKYKKSPKNTHIGLMADETPKEFLMNDGSAINTYSTIGILLRAVQQLSQRVKDLERGLPKHMG